MYAIRKNFSKEGINEAINIVENNFLKEKALDENGIVTDHSGSCGIMALINKNKLIIANIGDSRLVLFKKSSPFFITEDHKPNSPKEKLRIEKAGGSIYQTQTFIPIYQNGKKLSGKEYDPEKDILIFNGNYETFLQTKLKLSKLLNLFLPYLDLNNDICN